jgi:F-type H+-transporting ATPase subunit delta
MTSSLLAARYARALYDLAVEQDLLDRIQEELLTGVHLIESAEFSSIFFHPKVDKSAKKDLLAKVFVSYHPFVQDFISLLVDKGREKALGAIAQEYLTLARAHRGEITAEVTSAVKLNAAELAAIKAKLGPSADKVLVQETVDETILGGMIIKVGNKVYDGSLAMRIKSLHRQLAQAK